MNRDAEVPAEKRISHEGRRRTAEFLETRPAVAGPPALHAKSA